MVKDGKELHYFLCLEELNWKLSTTGFRKVKPVAEEDSEIVKQILTAKPGIDKVREEV